MLGSKWKKKKKKKKENYQLLEFQNKKEDFFF
jgi:hypothetical protein